MYSGLKADLYLLRDGDELRKSAFQRRLLVDDGPPIGEVYVHSPEDLILYKLMYLGWSGQSNPSRAFGGHRERTRTGYEQEK